MGQRLLSRKGLVEGRDDDDDDDDGRGMASVAVCAVTSRLERR